MATNIYVSNGYPNRAAYLDSLAAEYGRTLVYALADMLGPSEDFDGLITGLEDSSMFEDDLDDGALEEYDY